MNKLIEKVKEIKVSPRKSKKYRAKIYNPKTKEYRFIDFGARGYAQYKDSTKVKKYSKKDHNDTTRRRSYYRRHSKSSTKREAMTKERRKSRGKINAKILSHKYLW